MNWQFEEDAIYAEKSGKCRCGKRRTRRKKFYQTLNPFNKNADGSVKTREQIHSELKREVEQWKGEPITCDDCK